MLSVTILDFLEAVVERLVADRGARLAGLEAIAVQLVVVVGMLRRDSVAPSAMPARPAPATPRISRRFIVKSPKKRLVVEERKTPPRTTSMPRSTRGLGVRNGSLNHADAGRADPSMSGQYESDEMISPNARVAIARQGTGLMEDFRKWTEPSANSMFAPPGCMLQ